MKKLITLFIITISLSITNLSAQAPAWAWANSAGGLLDESGKSVTTDYTGNVYVTGFFRSRTIQFGTYTLTNYDTTGATDDVFIVKYDSSGGVLWAKSITGNGNDDGLSLSTDFMGNVYLTGSFTSTTLYAGFITLSNANTDSLSPNYDAFIAMYNVLGNIQWAKRFGGIGEEIISGVSTDLGGNTYITGSYSSDTVAFDTSKVVSDGSLNAFIAKLNLFGDVSWARSAGGIKEDKATGIATDSIGNIAITGYFFSNTMAFDTILLTKKDTTGSDTTGYSNDIFIAKYNSNGNVLWAKDAGGTNVYYDAVSSNGIAMDKKGNAYITGYFRYDSIFFDSIAIYLSSFSRDIFIAKYNQNGKAMWAQQAGGFLDDEGRGVAVDIQGSVFVTGDYSGGSITFDTTTINAMSADPDIFVVKLDSLGHVFWAKSTGGSIGDFANSIAVFDVNKVYVTGQYVSPSISFDAFTVTNQSTAGSGADLFVARLYPSTVGIPHFASVDNNLMVCPNPAVQYATISYSLKSATKVTLEIYNELGAKVVDVISSEKQSEGDYNYLFSAPQSGIYFVKLQTQDGVLVKRIVYTR